MVFKPAHRVFNCWACPIVQDHESNFLAHPAIVPPQCFKFTINICQFNIPPDLPILYTTRSTEKHNPQAPKPDLGQGNTIVNKVQGKYRLFKSRSYSSKTNSIKLGLCKVPNKLVHTQLLQLCTYIQLFNVFRC